MIELSLYCKEINRVPKFVKPSNKKFYIIHYEFIGINVLNLNFFHQDIEQFGF